MIPLSICYRLLQLHFPTLVRVRAAGRDTVTVRERRDFGKNAVGYILMMAKEREIMYIKTKIRLSLSRNRIAITYQCIKLKRGDSLPLRYITAGW